MNIVIFCIDRIQAGFLGPYGNTWVDTPGLNRLAAEGFLFENCLSATSDSLRCFRSLVSGRHPALLSDEADERIRLHDGKAILISDDREILESQAAQGFDEAYSLAPLALPSVAPADDWSETPIGRLAAETADILTQSPEPFTAYCRFDYLNHTWQAPKAIREHYLSEDDPSADCSTIPPRVRAEAEPLDPDLVFLHQVSYAAEITVLDRCIEGFLHVLDQARPNTVFVFTSARGYPLGEHGVVGPDERLYNETLHVPLLLRFPEKRYAGLRSPSLCYAHDLLPTLAKLVFPASDGDVASETMDQDEPVSSCPLCGRPNLDDVVRRPFVEPPVRREALMAAEFTSEEGETWALRTKHWFARGLRPSGNEERPDFDEFSVDAPNAAGELYFKPDDYWEVNDVADRCDEILAHATHFVRSVLERHASPAECGCDGSVPVPEALTRPVD
ncbi:MAG: hypothetical protein D6741_01925 [Planctomycetota bacterium]|nr:MAG: hypothetical protein D6741_01925 [Planctomycetota bacterium]